MTTLDNIKLTFPLIIEAPKIITRTNNPLLSFTVIVKYFSRFLFNLGCGKTALIKQPKICIMSDDESPSQSQKTKKRKTRSERNKLKSKQSETQVCNIYSSEYERFFCLLIISYSELYPKALYYNTSWNNADTFKRKG